VTNVILLALLQKWKYCVVGCREEFDYKKLLKENKDHYELWPIRWDLLECIKDYYEENEGLDLKYVSKIQILEVKLMLMTIPARGK